MIPPPEPAGKLVDMILPVSQDEDHPSHLECYSFSHKMLQIDGYSQTTLLLESISMQIASIHNDEQHQPTGVLHKQLQIASLRLPDKSAFPTHLLTR